MLHAIYKRASVLAMLAALGATAISATPAAKNEKTAATIERRAVEKTTHTIQTIGAGANHRYKVSLRAGQKATIVVRSNNEMSLGIKSPSGANKSSNGKQQYAAVLVGEGEFAVELGAPTNAVYRLKIVVE